MRSFEDLRAKGKAALEAGELNASLSYLEEALAIARRLSDPVLIDRAFCNRCALANVLTGLAEEDFDELRDILMRSRCLETTFAAAYNLSHAHELRKAFKKALFYAQVARDRALSSFQTELIAKSHNQIGNCLLAESYFEQAIVEYECALTLLTGRMTLNRSAILLNIGYAKTILGDSRKGFELLYKCLRWYHQSGMRAYEAWAHIFLCHAHLEVDRVRYAAKHGARGLEVAEATGNQEAVKNVLFLLGEVEKASADFDAASAHFRRLQREFYPEAENLPAMMLLCDTKQLVNLRA